MWFWNKKHTIASSGILQGAVDHHSHILPGVDDGVETMDEALHILATYETLGIKELWLTPHIMEDIPNTPQKLATRFEELKAAYKGCITLHLAAEYMIDNNLHKLIQEIDSPSLPRGTTRGSVVCDDGYFSTPKECPIGATKGEGVEKDCSCHSDHTLTNKSKEVLGAVQSKPFQETPPLFRGEVVEDRRGEKKTTERPKLLPIGTAGKHILVETSYFNPPMRFKETLRQIKSLGYYPLLAHPERYMYMDNDEYRRLREEGVKFQLNLVSLAGGYGATVKKKALWLLTNGLYSVAGSDLHSEDAIGFITKCKLSKHNIEQVELLLQNKI